MTEPTTEALVCREATRYRLARRLRGGTCGRPAKWRVTQERGAKASWPMCGIHVRGYRPTPGLGPNGWIVEALRG